MSKTTKIRWVIAHEPLNLFLRAAEDFERRVNEQQTEHKIEVEIMTLTEYSQRYNNGVVITKHDLLDLMEAGKIEMSQMYTTWLAEHYEQDMLVYDLPFLFKDHDHASRVLEGEIGESLLTKLASKSNVRGLSYTYSGGFRQMISNKKVSTLSELTGTTQRSNRNPVAKATLSALGITPHACEVEDLRKEVVAGNCEGGETNYPRMYPLRQNEVTTSVIDTEHSLFLTSMIIGEKFWSSLSTDVQAVIKTSAVLAGREERAETIRDGERAKVRLVQEEGATIHRLSTEEKADAIAKTAVVYDQFADMFTPGLVNSIKKMY
jgi:TRAP-type C4-dicarboxylate transport system substrate-binding protein